MPNMQANNTASATCPAKRAAPNINVAQKNANEMAITIKPKVSLVIILNPYCYVKIKRRACDANKRQQG
jgi:hypothetical protein